jgi:hypothetical protein
MGEFGESLAVASPQSEAGCPNIAKARKHSRERPIAKYPMMDQRGASMEAGDNHQRMSKDLVHLVDVPRERPILNPRRCDFGQSKYRNSVTTRELQPYPRDGNRDQ